MRPKSQSVQVYNNLKPLKVLQYLDYSICIYECIVLRKKFLSSAKRYLYLFPNQIAICKEPKKILPDRQVPVNNQTTVSWTHKHHKKDNTRVLKSVTFHVTDKREFEYLADDKVLRDLKQHLALYVFQTKIQDEYQAVSVMGKGSYATVIQLVNLCTNKQYAAKCIDQKKILDKPKAPLQLSYEIQAMRMLGTENHPNILQIHELFIGNNNFYIVMDLALGGSLQNMMKKREKLLKKKRNLFNQNEICLIMRQLLEGLSYMHSFNLMHRDLKPDNILFSIKNDLGSLKIADFGLAQSTTEHPYIFAKCGTPGFVAPEIFEASERYARYGVECDVFSAGVIYYILLTGEPVFEAKERHQLIEINKKCDIDIDKICPKQVSRQEAELLKKMLAKQPENRISAEQCLNYFANKDQFHTEDYLYVESEVDITHKKNIADLTKYKRLCISNNPFVKLRQREESRIKEFESQFKQLETSLIIMSNLNLGKNSGHNFDGIGQQFGSFLITHKKIEEEEHKL